MRGFWLALAFLCLLSVTTMANKIETGFLNRRITIGQKSYPYQVYVPANYSHTKRWPVILFLHGKGERGDDGLLQTDVGLATTLRRHSDRFPAIIVFPQCPVTNHWTDPKMSEQAIKALDKTILEFNGDAQRVYLTGISMGGAGSWYMAARYPNRFAAVVPVCGWVVPPVTIDSLSEVPGDMAVLMQADDAYLTLAKQLSKTPIWIFHGEADNVVPVTESRKMFEALKKVSGNVKYSEYDKIGHNSWDLAYSETDLAAWIFSQILVKHAEQP